VITLNVPPLRERPSDIPLLVEHFVAKHSSPKLRVSKTALDALVRFAWPGNVRQLENEIRRALVLADTTVELEHLSAELRGAVRGQPAVSDELNLRQRVDLLEAELVTIALERTMQPDGAAELLGLSRFAAKCCDDSIVPRVKGE
jgi:transcriptional regulator with PAS, ATPase and Fis domain